MTKQEVTELGKVLGLDDFYDVLISKEYKPENGIEQGFRFFVSSTIAGLVFLFFWAVFGIIVRKIFSCDVGTVILVGIFLSFPIDLLVFVFLNRLSLRQRINKHAKEYLRDKTYEDLIKIYTMENMENCKQDILKG